MCARVCDVNEYVGVCVCVCVCVVLCVYASVYVPEITKNVPLYIKYSKDQIKFLLTCWRLAAK